MPARLLRLLPPETAHSLAHAFLNFYPSRRAEAPGRLAVEIAGLRLAHPIGLAAGFSKDGHSIRGLHRQGFSFIEVGTVTPRPQAGNRRPRLFRLTEDRALVNRMGFNSAGLEAAAARLAAPRPPGAVVGANIGINRDSTDPVGDYALGLRRLYPLTDYVTVNVSSPNTPGLRALQNALRLRELAETLVGECRRLAAAAAKKPLFVKLAPDLEEEELEAIARVAVESGVDGLIMGNTTIARPRSLRSRHAAEAGGLSGRPLLEPSTERLRSLARHLDGRLPLVGVGGIATAEDVLAKIEAGATAVQLYTAFVYEGPGLVRRLVRDLDRLLERRGYARLEDAIGADLRGA
jgi:dihydroorotate dehydrogenase